MQNDADGHDTCGPWFLTYSPIWTGVLHELPLKVTAWPSSSSTTQNDEEAHDTCTSSKFSVYLAGALHELPLNATYFEPRLTAIQNDEEEHDTDSNACA